MTEPKRPLRAGIVWGSGLGDLLAIYPLIHFLSKEKCAEITYLTKKSHLPEMFEQLSADLPGVSVQFIPENFRILSFVYRYWRYFDALFVMEDRFCFWNRLFSLALFPRKLCAGASANDFVFIAAQVRDHVRRCFGWEWSEERPRFPFCDAVSNRTQRLDFSRPYLVLHASSGPGWQTTSWPSESWIELMGRLLVQSDFDLCLVGLRADDDRYRQMIDKLPVLHRRRVRIALDRPLAEVATLLKQGRGVICHNSGIMHLAAELGVATLVLNGASARYWQRNESWVTNITSGSCLLACNRRRCPVPGFHSKCIREIQVDTVMKHCKTLFLT